MSNVSRGVKLFLLDKMRYTPFDRTFSDDYKYLEKNGVCLTDSIEKADLFVCSSFKKKLLPVILKNYKRPILLWTNEPRNSTFTKNLYFPVKMKFLNVYSEKVFFNNVTYQKRRFLNRPLLQPLDPKKVMLNRTAVALMSFYKGTTGNKLKVHGVDVDLINMRNEIALFGYSKGVLDIYGKGWPKGIAKENSREGNWGKAKQIILSQYNFNLAFENTVAPYYVTEKIWDAVENYCLPIYYGGKNSTIYEDFPIQSFLDYSLYKSPAALFKDIMNISTEEYICRMNKCIATYNRFVQKDISFWEQIKDRRLANIIEVCKTLSRMV